VSATGITAKLAAELKALRELPDSEIDYSDIPLKLDWHNAEVGKFYRPLKKIVSLRVDADILDWFKHKADGKQYTTIMNRALRSYIAAEESLKKANATNFRTSNKK
jgi:uncharacterized protein (DUF4415 family)